MPKQQVVILFGPPGAGKGTQSELVADKLGLYYIETSKVGETAINKAQQVDFVEVEDKKYYFSDQQKLWEQGKLWDPPFVVHFMKEKIKELHSQGNGLILAGSPRTAYESEKLTPFLKDLYGVENIKVVLIKLKPEDSIFRNSHRRICELMRHPTLYSEETANLQYCPLDGSKLVKREGLDNPETIKVRLKEYEERTLPIISHFKQEGLIINEVNGSPPPADVFKSILNALE